MTARTIKGYLYRTYTAHPLRRMSGSFSAEVEQRLVACRALPPEPIYEQLYAMEGDELPPLPMETDALPRHALLKAHERLIFYVRKWLVNADGDMTPERAVDEMCADRQLDLLFREPPLAEVVRFPRRMAGGKANVHFVGGCSGKNCERSAPPEPTMRSARSRFSSG